VSEHESERDRIEAEQRERAGDESQPTPADEGVRTPTAEPMPAPLESERRPAAAATAAPTGTDNVLPPQFGGDVDDVARRAPGSGEGGYVSARPQLTVGDAGPAVTELALLLASHGYPNPITDGQRVAPHALDDALMRQVQEFQAEHGVNPAAPFGEGATNGPLIGARHGGLVDAHTWEALLGRKPELSWDAAQGVVA
jgi:hypothetical protein